MESATQKARGGRPATGAGTSLNVRLHADLLGLLDVWITSQAKPHPSRPEAVRLILEDWFVGQGLKQHREDPEGAN